MSCGKPEFVASLDALLAGELSPAAYAQLRAHVATCDACRLDYERISRVDSHLERRALPEQRQQLLEGELFGRLGVTQPVPANVIRPARWAPRRIATVALGLAASIVLAVLVAPRVLSSGDEFQARGGAAQGTYGIRAFCVDASSSKVLSEAQAGQTLRCAQGQLVQFSHTAPEPATLQITAPGPEPLTFFPREGASAAVAQGTDVPLPFSTPVQSGWLNAPLTVTATFTHEGRVVAESRIVLAPAE